MGDQRAPYRRATEADLTDVRKLLAARALPVDDLTPELLRTFLLHRDEGEILGCAGLEVYGEVALVRSLAVSESAEGSGLGSSLVGALEELAHHESVRTLFLLTTTAQEFFKRRGYENADRASAPPAIRNTDQFSDLCPASAAFMKKDL